jgi:hypothetical protein
MMVSRIQPDVEMSRVGYELVTASQIYKNFDPETKNTAVVLVLGIFSSIKLITLIINV